jgi:hypothetical protein
MNNSLFNVYINPSLDSMEFLMESGKMDQINISSWSASFSPSSSIITFSLKFVNFAYISQDFNYDKVVIDFLQPERINATKSGIILQPERR